MPSSETFTFEILEDQKGKVLKTRLNQPARKTLTPIEEAVKSAKAIHSQAGSEKPGLILSNTIESSALLNAFVKSDVPFDAVILSIKQGDTQLNERLINLCKKHGIETKVFEFDFGNTEHIAQLEKISAELGCNNLKTLLDLWTACQTDHFTVLAGNFTFPVNPVKVSEFQFNLPGPEDKKYFDFFSYFGGEPCFLGSTAELATSFLKTVFANEVYTLSKVNQDAVEFDFAAKLRLYLDSGFSEDFLISSEDPYPLEYQLKFSSQEQVEYFGLKRQKFHSDNSFRSFIQEAPGVELKTVDALRPVTKAILKNWKGAGLSYSQNAEADCFLLFPKVVSKHEFKGDLAAVLKLLETEEYFLNIHNQSTDKKLHLKPEMKDLVKFFDQSLKAHLKIAGIFLDDVQITQCWGNKTVYGNRHHIHTHSNSYISGIFYLTTGGGGHTAFHNEKTEAIQPLRDEDNLFSATYFQVKPQAGMLLLFPSGIPHSTYSNISDQPRYTISFNVMPKGNIGMWYGANWAKF